MAEDPKYLWHALVGEDGATVEDYLPVVLSGSGGPGDEQQTLLAFPEQTPVTASTSTLVEVVGGLATLRQEGGELSAAEDISEAAVLWQLRNRFRGAKLGGQVYSTVGGRVLLVSVNPYKEIPSLYSDETLRGYLVPGEDGGGGGAPHLWATVRNAFGALRRDGLRQAVVMGGESGSGKSEATKRCLQYLSAASAPSSSSRVVVERLLACSTLMESFGHAQTAKNDNSSRFGKWLEVCFAPGGQLQGARVLQYLLEKSRVTAVHPPGERNFHVFYQLCAHNKTHDLLPSEQYAILLSTATASPGIDDEEAWFDAQSAWSILQFPESTSEAILAAVKAILWLGNVEFDDASSWSKVEDDGHLLEDGAAVVNATSMAALEKAAALLGTSVAALTRVLTSRTIVINREPCLTPIDVLQAADARNALVRELYARLFAHLANHANLTLAGRDQDSSSSDPKAGDLSLGILDMFGVEELQRNSFEQLCISYANEKLQQHFVQWVVVREREIYLAEDVHLLNHGASDNSEVIALIEGKPHGLLALLDNESRSYGADGPFMDKVVRLFVHSDEPPLGSAQLQIDLETDPGSFQVRHFFGTVKYDAREFVEKNTDAVAGDLEDFFRGPELSPALRAIVSVQPQNEGGSASDPSTTSSRFQAHLRVLIELLNLSSPHFVRCIKPNETKSADHFESATVLRQLRSSGVLEALEIHKRGYAVRMPHLEFRQLYWALAGVSALEMKEIVQDLPQARQDATGELLRVENEAICRILVQRFVDQGGVFDDGLRVGKTLVFMRPAVLAHLVAERQRLLAANGAMIASNLGPIGKMIPAMTRYALLIAALHEVRELMRLGRQREQSNTSVLPRLKEMINYCETIKMQSFHLKNASKMVDRLTEVKMAVDRISAHLAACGGNAFADVIEEAEAAEELLSFAQRLKISAPEVQDLQKRLPVLREKAACLRQLRASMEALDAAAISHNLGEISKLEATIGSFCAQDVSKAQNILYRLAREDLLLGEIMKELDSFHKSCEDRLRMPQTEEALSEWLATATPDAVEQVEPFFAVFEEEPALAPWSIEALAALLLLCDSYPLWHARDWKRLAESLQGCLVKVKLVGEAKITTQTSAALPKVVAKFTSFVSAQIHANVLYPALQAALSSGGVHHATEDQEETDWETPDSVLDGVDFAQLKAVLDQARACLWLTDRSTSVLLHVETVFLTRRAVKLRKPCAGMSPWELVCRLTEERSETARRTDASEALRELSKLAEQNQKKTALAGATVEESQATPAAEQEVFDRVAFLQESCPSLVSDIAQVLSASSSSSSSSSAPFILPILQLVQNETAAARSVALYRLMLSSILDGLKLAGTVAATPPAQVASEMGLPPATWPSAEQVAPEPLAAVLAIIDVLIRDLPPSADSVQSMLIILLSARSAFHDEHWDILLANHESDLFDPLLSPVPPDAGAVSAQILALIRLETINVIREARNNLCVQELLEAMSSGCLVGPVGKINSQAIDIASVKAAIEGARKRCEAPATAATPFNGMNEKLYRLLAFCKVFVEARNVFKSAFPLDMKKAAVTALEKILPTIESPQLRCPTLEREIRDMKAEMSYLECLAILEKGLKLEAPVHYVIPATASSLTTSASTSTSTSTRRQSNSDLGTWYGIIAEEHMELNEKVLDTEVLEEGLKRALELRHNEGNLLPGDLELTLRAAELIKTMRQAALNGRWPEAASAFTFIKEEQLAINVPIIQAEVLGAGEPINNYLAITECKKALKKGMGKGVVGAMMYELISVDVLEGALRDCMKAGGSKSSHAEELIKAVSRILEVRRAQKNGDRGQLKDALAQATAVGIGKGLTELCAEELERAQQEYDNDVVLEALKRAVIDEEMKTHVSLLHTGNISTWALREAIKLADKFTENKSDEEAPVVKRLCEVLNVVLSTRTEANMGEANLEPLRVLWELKLSNFLEYISALEMGLTAPVGDKSSRKMSIFLRESIVGTEEENAAGADSVAAATAPPKKCCNLMAPFEPMIASMRRDILTIKQHFKVQALE